MHQQVIQRVTLNMTEGEWELMPLVRHVSDLKTNFDYKYKTPKFSVLNAIIINKI